MTGLEIELKAGLMAADAAVLARRLNRLGGPASGPVKLAAIYYDTANRHLAKQGIAFRVRREDGLLVQTVKAGRTQLGGFHQVREVSARLARATPNPEAVADPALRARIQELIANDPLQRRFETRVSRRLWRVQHEHGLVEVAMDRGEIRAGTARQPIIEVEFELLGGSPEALFAVARQLIGDLPADLSIPNKAARGEALATGKPRRLHAAASKPPVPEAGTGGEASWRLALGSAAMAIAANLALTGVSGEPEGPHQLRVALRRLRAAERLHRPLLAEEVSLSIRTMARDIGRAVAPLRDSDVLTAELLGVSEQAGLAALLAASNQAERSRARLALRHLQSTGFAIRLIELAAIGGWKPETRKPDQPVERLAALAVGRLWKRASRLGDRLSTLSDEDRHEFRKLLKKLRYCLEITPLSDSRKPFSSALKRLQEDLGTLNDVAVLESWVPMEAATAEAVSEARAQLLKAARGKTDLSLGRACRHWRDLRAETRPWEAPATPSQPRSRNR